MIPSDTASVLVLGAAGRFGAAAVQAFAAAGWRVFAQQRREPATLQPGVAVLRTPLADTDALVRQAGGTRVVVYAVNPPYARWEAELLPLFEQGLAVAERLGARLMLPGNVYNFGASMPPRLTEATPMRPSTRKGELRVAMEDELQRRAARGLDSVVIRAGDFYGGGRGSWLDLAVVKDLGRGRLVYPGPLDLPHAWAYLPDLARAFVAVAERGARGDAAAVETLHFAGHTLTGAELLDTVQAAAADLGAVPPAVSARGWRRGGMPWGLIRVMGMVVPTMRAIAEMSYLWRVPHALDGARLQARIGTLPVTPPRQALRQALAELGFAAVAQQPQAAL